jgi:hypothetical protein
METGNSSNQGLEIFWNNQSGYGRSDFLNYGQGGGGGFTWNTTNSTNVGTPKLLAVLDTTGLSLSSNLTCSNAVITGTLNNSNISNIGNLQYLDTSSSLTTQLSNKQPLLTSSSPITCSTLTLSGNITLNSSYNSGPNASSQLGYSSYNVQTNTATYSISPTLLNNQATVQISLPSMGYYVISTLAQITIAASTTNARFSTIVKDNKTPTNYTLLLSPVNTYFPSTATGTIFTMNSIACHYNNLAVNTLLTVYFSCQSSVGTASLNTNFYIQYVRIG